MSHLQVADTLYGLFEMAAGYVDNHFGEHATDLVVNATVIDRAAERLKAGFRGNPRTAAFAAAVPYAVDLVKIGFSVNYRGKTFREAAADRFISSKIPVPFAREFGPEYKSIFKTVAKDLVAETLNEHQREQHGRRGY